MIQAFFNPTINLGISILMFAAGLVLTIGRLFGLVGVDEPPLVFHMSAWALVVSGYGNILVSVTRKENSS